MKGRRKPYTEIGIARVPCSRCGKPSEHQWQVCANDNRYLGICKACDIKLNRIVLRFMGWSKQDANRTIKAYANS